MLSASLWGCELKCQRILVEGSLGQSASLWGCELKCTRPLIEFDKIIVSLLVRLWVEIMIVPSGKRTLGVSLLVRLWVEIPSETPVVLNQYVSLLVRLWVEIMRISDTGVTSIGQPPCEAVSWNAPRVSTDGIILCQPPCEAVSWNVSSFVGRWVAGVVSLLVRLWVEIWWSYRHNNRKNVSLLVRLWVEIIVKVIGNYLALVSLLVRLWVEIMIRNLLWSVVIRQPPCEAVSWNLWLNVTQCIHVVSLLVRLWVEISVTTATATLKKSASLWGCELKCLQSVCSAPPFPSASLWGCELK